MKCGCRTKLFECFNDTGKTHSDTELEAMAAWNKRSTEREKSAYIPSEECSNCYCNQVCFEFNGVGHVEKGFLEYQKKYGCPYFRPDPQSEWISVDERLPQEDGPYLAHIKLPHLAFEKLTVIATIMYGKNHGFYKETENDIVTHWMPLPEAPKMKGGAE